VNVKTQLEIQFTKTKRKTPVSPYRDWIGNTKYKLGFIYTGCTKMFGWKFSLLKQKPVSPYRDWIGNTKYKLGFIYTGCA